VPGIEIKPAPKAGQPVAAAAAAGAAFLAGKSAANAEPTTKMAAEERRSEEIFIGNIHFYVQWYTLLQLTVVLMTRNSKTSIIKGALFQL
jgi:hypothetical protein